VERSAAEGPAAALAVAFAVSVASAVASALAFAVAVLSVIPAGNLLIPRGPSPPSPHYHTSRMDSVHLLPPTDWSRGQSRNRVAMDKGPTRTH